MIDFEMSVLESWCISDDSWSTTDLSDLVRVDSLAVSGTSCWCSEGSAGV